MDGPSTVTSTLDVITTWKRHIEELCEGSVIRSDFRTGQYVEPLETDAFGILNSPLDPQLPCKICAIRTVQLFYIEPDAVLSTTFNTWRSDTPTGLAQMAAVFNSAALTDEEKATWYNGDRTMPANIHHDQWIERSVRAFMEQCPHRKYALSLAAHYPMVYSEEQPVNVTTDPVARDYEHLAMESTGKTFMARNRIVVFGGSNAQGLAHTLGKDAQFVEADTSETIVARASKLFPSRMTRLAIIWPQSQAVPQGVLEAARRAADRLLEFKQMRVLILAPASKQAHHFAYATMLHRLDNMGTMTLRTIGTELINAVSDNKERSFFSEHELKPAGISAVAELSARTLKDTFGMAVMEHRQKAPPGCDDERRVRKRKADGEQPHYRRLEGRIQTPTKLPKLASRIQKAADHKSHGGPSAPSSRRK